MFYFSQENSEIKEQVWKLEHGRNWVENRLTAMESDIKDLKENMKKDDSSWPRSVPILLQKIEEEESRDFSQNEISTAAENQNNPLVDINKVVVNEEAAAGLFELADKCSEQAEEIEDFMQTLLQRVDSNAY